MESRARQPHSHGRRREGAAGRPGVEHHPVPTYPRLPDPPNPDDLAEASRTFDVAKREYDRFLHNRGKGAFVCIGSIKSNPASELPVARAFRARPFREDLPKSAVQRAVPFFFAYRRGDLRPPSCHGGTRLDSTAPHPPTPGIHYETEGGKWKFVSCDDKAEAALIFYVYHPSLASFELTLGGFTGRSTQALRDVIGKHARELWPGSLETREACYGAFVIRMEFPRGRKDTIEDAHLTPRRLEIIRLPAEVIERRLLTRSRTSGNHG